MSIRFAGTVQVKGKAIVHPCGTPQVDNCYHGICYCSLDLRKDFVPTHLNNFV